MMKMMMMMITATRIIKQTSHLKKTQTTLIKKTTAPKSSPTSTINSLFYNLEREIKWIFLIK